MRYTAKHRYADVSARKIRPFANMIRGRNVDDALQLLRFYHNRGAKLLMAVVQSAYGNADDQECPDSDELIVAECRVDGAPMFKRIQPRARGTAFQIKCRMSHIVVALEVPETADDEAVLDIRESAAVPVGAASTPPSTPPLETPASPAAPETAPATPGEGQPTP
jgi:large subunit ribosomal protein L22